jgi:murein L,D-transpeptidase YafK
MLRGLCLFLALAGPVQALAETAALENALAVADRVVIEKGRRTLTLYAAGQPLASFQVALGREPVGRKLCQGDNKTPEGRYYISGRKLDSDFHRALQVSYPSDEDIARAKLFGCDPGGQIMIHGLKPERAWVGSRHSIVDWTKGCVAVTNEEIERIWFMVPDGAPVEIKP